MGNFFLAEFRVLAKVAAGMQGRKERMNWLAVSVAAEWNLWNEAAKGIKSWQKQRVNS